MDHSLEHTEPGDLRRCLRSQSEHLNVLGRFWTDAQRPSKDSWSCWPYLFLQFREFCKHEDYLHCVRLALSCHMYRSILSSDSRSGCCSCRRPTSHPSVAPMPIAGAVSACRRQDGAHPQVKSTQLGAACPRVGLSLSFAGPASIESRCGCFRPREDPMAAPVVRVGIGILLVRASDNRVLIGQRLSAHGHGTFALPGGHLEVGESFERCAARELEEETGIVVPDSAFRVSSVVNSVFSAEKHYVTVFMKARVDEQYAHAQTLEPNKCSGWLWADWAELTTLKAYTPLFLPLQTLVEKSLAGEFLL
ncbi:Nudix hydrolase 1 [Porphyridium purpureum]|uniref:Nudix hydrolase 1 n=1 Tax=Porphyridium purpureum TaxID=35688 RepID=A0A5J4YNH2_PORPP|nr:Nudix hydrolase 1 [Porphyridium purpureum]|eukprot:POR0019..scf249_10